MKTKLSIPFTDQSPSFTYGVEFGRILQKIEQGDLNIDNNGFSIRVENKELIQSTCEYYKYIPVFGRESSGWIEFMGIKDLSSNN